MILAAIASLPAQFVAAYQQNPETWNLIGLAMLGFLMLTILGNRISRRGRRDR